MNQRGAGYTLLEMVVVMAVIAVATAVAAPPSYRMIRSWQEATDVQDVIQQLERLPSKVRADGRPLNIDPQKSAATNDLPPTEGQASAPHPSLEKTIDLPENWQLQVQTPLHVRVNGACSDSQILLVTEQQTVPLQIQAPFCRVQRLPQ